MNKWIVIAAVSALFSVSGANAADLGRSLKDEPASAPAYSPAYSWTGFYVGVNGGYGWGDARESVVGAERVRDYTFEGGLVGAQAGLNWQFAPAWLIGVEGSLSWTDISGSDSFETVIGRHTNDVDMNWLADVSGRVGYVRDRVLVYGKLGAAWANTDHSSVIASPRFGTVPFHSDSQNTVGLLVGGGVEFALGGGLSLKAEYNYIDFNTGRFGLYGPDGHFGQSIDFENSASIIKAGLNLKIGGR